MYRKFVLGAIALLPLAACDIVSSDDDAQIALQLTDAPSDIIESAEVWISRVYLQGGPNDDDQDDEDGDTPDGRVDLFNDPANPFQVDLLVLTDGVTAELSAPVDIPAGAYKGLRIVVDSAFVTLKPGYTFPGGVRTKALKTPSASTSGLKVHLAGAIDAEEGAVTTLLLDFDVDQSFGIHGSEPTAPGQQVDGMVLHPVIREMDRDTDE
jgi:hypothetical protein